MILANPARRTGPVQIRVVMRREAGIQDTNRWRKTPMPGMRASRSRASPPVRRMLGPQMPMQGVPRAKRAEPIPAQPSTPLELTTRGSLWPGEGRAGVRHISAPVRPHHCGEYPWYQEHQRACGRVPLGALAAMVSGSGVIVEHGGPGSIGGYWLRRTARGFESTSFVSKPGAMPDWRTPVDIVLAEDGFPGERAGHTARVGATATLKAVCSGGRRGRPDLDTSRSEKGEAMAYQDIPEEDLVARFVTAFNDGDFAAIDDLLSADATLVGVVEDAPTVADALYEFKLRSPWTTLARAELDMMPVAAVWTPDGQAHHHPTGLFHIDTDSGEIVRVEFLDVSHDEVTTGKLLAEFAGPAWVTTERLGMVATALGSR